jgi:predicted DNA-binding transcriptional regulator AlpA
MIDLTNKKFGRLKVLRFSHKDDLWRHFWLCVCDCGNEKTVNYYNLKSGATKSCGCLRSEKARRIKHGMSKTRFHNIYKGIRQRCFDKKVECYSRYGGKGIRCYWDTFEEFKSDMYESYLKHIEKHGEKNTTIDRIENEKGYFKENCRWATIKEQALNRKDTTVCYYNGGKISLNGLALELSKKSGLSQSAIVERMKKNISIKLPKHTQTSHYYKYDMCGFASWKEFALYCGISRQWIFKLLKKGLTTNEIKKRYEKNITN